MTHESRATELTAVFACGECDHKLTTDHAPTLSPTPRAMERPCPECDPAEHDTELTEDAAIYRLQRFEDSTGAVVSDKQSCRGSRDEGVERSEIPHPDAVDIPAMRDMGRMKRTTVARLCYNLREGQEVLFDRRTRPLTVTRNVEKDDDYSAPGDRIVVLEGNGTTYTLQVSKAALENGEVLRLRSSSNNVSHLAWVWPAEGGIGILADGPSAAEFVTPAVDDTPTIAYRTMREPDDIPSDAEWLGDCPRECHGQVWGIENRAECDECATACDRAQWDLFADDSDAQSENTETEEGNA